eukprot:g1164.t1
MLLQQAATNVLAGCAETEPAAQKPREMRQRKKQQYQQQQRQHVHQERTQLHSARQELGSAVHKLRNSASAGLKEQEKLQQLLRAARRRSKANHAHSRPHRAERTLPPEATGPAWATAAAGQAEPEVHAPKPDAASHTLAPDTATVLPLSTTPAAVDSESTTAAADGGDSLPDDGAVACAADAGVGAAEEEEGEDDRLAEAQAQAAIWEARARSAQHESARATRRAETQTRAHRASFENLQRAVQSVADDAESKAKELRELRLISVRWAQEEVRLRGELNRARARVADGERDRAAQAMMLARAEQRAASLAADVQALEAAQGLTLPTLGLRAGRTARAAASCEKEAPGAGHTPALAPKADDGPFAWLLSVLLCSGCSALLSSFGASGNGDESPANDAAAPKVDNVVSADGGQKQA